MMTSSEALEGNGSALLAGHSCLILPIEANSGDCDRIRSLNSPAFLLLQNVSIVDTFAP